MVAATATISAPLRRPVTIWLYDLSSRWKNGTFLLLAATCILDFIIRQVKHRGMSCLRVRTAA